MDKDITLVLGASLKEYRVSNRLIHELREKGHKVKAIGLRDGMVGDVRIVKGKPDLRDIHTVSLYLSAANQEALEDYILSLNPERIIFNPGAENPRLMQKAREADIEAFNACSLVMIRVNQFFD